MLVKLPLVMLTVEVPVPPVAVCKALKLYVPETVLPLASGGNIKFE